MNCERFEELLIDFMEDEITPSEKETVKRHLESCPYCSKKLEEYLEVRRKFNEETLPQPSAQVLNRLSGIAREEIERDKTPFWKKWFYSPILVPLLSSALALFIWISYGENNVDLLYHGKPYSGEVMARKTPLAKGTSLPEIAEDVSRRTESQPGNVLPSQPSSAYPQASEGKILTQREEALSAPAPAGGLAVSEDAKEADKSSGYEDKSFAQLEAESMNEPTSKQPHETEEKSLRALGYMGEDVERSKVSTEQEVRQDKGKINYDERLNLILRQQKEGNCEASIKTSKELLSASPPPPDSIKEKAYLSLAECYEQKGEWNVAIVNYKNLQKVAPEQTAFAKEKIEYLEQKNTLLKSRKLKSLGSTGKDK
ncbi:MAG TPA: anti-sigma factor [Thermodesulfobacteriota bacterium]|nr:anti-sigma factor [Thermodesulfobacteriota bacterium]